MSFVKVLEDMAGMVSMNTHLKGVLGFRGVSDLEFLFIVYIWHDVHNGSGSKLSQMYWQTYTISTTSGDLLDLCPNLWCNNPKDNFFLGILFCDFDSSFVSTKNICFCCGLCGNITAFYLLSLKKNVQNYLWKRHICSEFINIIMENNWLHKSGANSLLYNVAMEGFPLSSPIFIWTIPVCFTVTKSLHVTSIYDMFPPMVPI